MKDLFSELSLDTTDVGGDEEEDDIGTTDLSSSATSRRKQTQRRMIPNLLYSCKNSYIIYQIILKMTTLTKY